MPTKKHTKIGRYKNIHGYGFDITLVTQQKPEFQDVASSSADFPKDQILLTFVESPVGKEKIRATVHTKT